MSRYRGPRRRVIRKLGNLPGLTTKQVDIYDSRVKTPGQHGQTIRRFLKHQSSYGLRLIEKQKLRFNYHLTEKQLVRYVNNAKKSKQATGDALLTLLELRLDNVIYRLGMAPTILAARQLVTHGHILVNKKKVNIPSYACTPKDKITVQAGSQKLIRKNLKIRCEILAQRKPITQAKKFFSRKSKKSLKNKTKQIKWRPPRHLELNRKNLIGLVKRKATRNSLQFQINELLVIEYYSQK